MTTTPTHDLAAFVAELAYDDLPTHVRERVKDLTLDAIACALAGQQGDETAQIRALASALGASTESTVIGGEPLSQAGATLLNGYLVTAVTVCDVHRPTLCHVTPEVIPPVFAVAERRDASGRDLLLAIAAGLETMTRVGLGMDYPTFRARGWHSPGVIGPFGGAAAVGKLLGLDAERQCAAFGLAGSQSAGTFAAWGTPTVKFHQARGGLSGLLAALLAEQGFRASDEILAHPDGGLFNTYSSGGRPDLAVADLGRRWELENISLRLWPAASSIQSVITALLVLIEAHDLRADDVVRVRIGLSESVYRMHGTLGWEDKFRALLSTRYVGAVVLHDRRCWLDQFTSDRIQDPVVDRFARERIEVEQDPNTEGTAAVVEISMTDGTVLIDRRAVPRGDAADPLTRAQIQDKFRMASDGLLPPDAAERTIERLGHLERLEHVGDLIGSLRVSKMVLAGR